MKQSSRVLGARIITFLFVCFLALQGQARAPQPLAITKTKALNLYDRGNYFGFFTLLNRDGAVDRDLFKTFERDANRCMDLPAESQQRRRFVSRTNAELEAANWNSELLQFRKLSEIHCLNNRFDGLDACDVTPLAAYDETIGDDDSDVGGAAGFVPVLVAG
jgi:hypothetical protein